MTNPALWTAIAGVIAAVTALIHSMFTAKQVNQHAAADINDVHRRT